MNYQLILSLVQSIIDTISNVSKGVVGVLKTHTFAVNVKNPVKKVDVKGQVVVSNLKNLDKPLENLKKAVFGVSEAVVQRSNEVVVKNFPEEIKVSNFPKSKIEDLLADLIKKVYTLHKPLSDKEFTIKQMPEVVVENLEFESGKIVKAIKGLKLDPKINVQAPKPDRIVVPPAQVNVEQIEIDYEKLAKSISGEIPEIDYKKLASVLSKEMSGFVVTGGGGGGKYAFKKSDGTATYGLVDENRHLQVDVLSAPTPASTDEPKYYTHDVDRQTTYTYIGSLTILGLWQISKITNVTGVTRYMRGTTGYTTNWTNRESLDYGYINEV